MDSRFQVSLSTLAGAVFFLYFVADRYWKSFGWLLGRWDPNMGHATEDKLIKSANRTALIAALLLAVWAFVGPSPYRQTWAVEVMGTAIGMLTAYVLLVSRASLRAAAKRR
ncbi:TPA: hypothetical protein QDZ34_000404 [Stenotrophomonas maltophilia]|nr:hypothetical protein [Stenotrophomonas maltophilia]HDS1024245.1 hypothetical protein [Stenotrophomonas maltophilia]HDS1028713.1 hypothetical protein [Stenotrophomonas maltophilia]HDS1033101.1 hypothetical protein [Stenotrophomonas maltophilia]